MIGAVLEALRHEWEIVKGGGATWFSASAFLLTFFLAASWAVEAAVKEKEQRVHALAQRIATAPVDLVCRLDIRLKKIPAGSYRLSGGRDAIVMKEAGKFVLIALDACREAEDD